MPPSWFFVPTLENYLSIFTKGVFSSYFINSLIIALGSTFFSLCIGTLGAYGFSRFEFKGRRDFAFFILSARFAPPVLVLLPFYMVFLKLRLVNTYHGLILLYLSFQLPFVVWVMQGFFNEVPRELDEAALVDGCSHFRAFLSIVLPVSLPGIVATAIYSFILAWNEFLFALILTKNETKTLPVAITGFLSTFMGTLWGEITAATTITIIPAIVFIFLVQKHLVRGLTFGVIKR
jgi:multiple sugar transport system permease protein